MATEFDYGEAKAVLAGALLATGLDLAGASGVAQRQVEALAEQLLVTVPFYRAPPGIDDQRVCHALVTAMVSEMPDAATGVLESIDNPYGAIMVLAGIVGAIVGHSAEVEATTSVAVWQRVCAAVEADQPDDDGPPR